MDLQEDGTPYRTMIEVIVKFLTTSASRKVSHTATSTKTSYLKEGVADLTAREKGGACKTPTSDVPRPAEGSSPSDSKKNKVHQDENTQITTSKMGSLLISQHGKPITKSLATNPITHELSHSHPSPSRLSEVSESTPSHLHKPVYPRKEPSPLKESTGYGSTIEPWKHSTSLLEKDQTSVVNVKPRGGMESLSGNREGGVGGSVITVAPGHVISPGPTSSTRSSARGIFKSGHSSLVSRETPTLKSDNKTGSVKQKPYRRRNTYRDSTGSNKEVTVQDEATSSLHASLITDCKFY